MAEATRVWLMRAGGRGEDEESAITNGRAIIGFRDAKDLATYHSVDELAMELLKVDSKPNKDRSNVHARQLWAFGHSIKQGDIAVIPLKSQPGQIALGRVAGPYEFVKVGGELRHTRRIEWLKATCPRSRFQQDLLYSFGAFLTVCEIQRNNARERVAVVYGGGQDPGFVEVTKETTDAATVEIASDAGAAIDLAQAAHDEIITYVRQRYQAHDLARLVGAILSAEGYAVNVSPPGPDGGADILAGRGPLGLDAPTLCVQVKATETAADVKIFRELVGTMDTFKADQGLLVCWGGFTSPLKNEARQKHFKVRLWDQSDIVSAIYRVYDKLSPEVQTELPLKRVWMLVREDLS